MQIQDIKVCYYALPLEGNLVDALHGKHDNFELILAKVRLSNGVEGVGYTYTGGIGGKAIAKLMEVDLKPRLIGKTLDDIAELNQYMNNAIHYVARGGIASFAISAFDIAFWDADLKTKGVALADVFGTRQETVETYYGGIDLMFTEKELLDNIEKQLKLGHRGIKIKVGKENEEEDVARAKAVRNLIGYDAKFAIDANMVWSVEQSIRMAKKMEQFNPFWLEEPTNPDDYLGYASIGQATSIPVAMGENLHSRYEHQLALDIGRVKEIIPDCSNCCGITGVFQVAKLAKERSLKVHTHGAQEIHANILGALDNAGMVEYHSFPIYQYTVEGLPIYEGRLKPSFEAGVGVQFDWEKMERCKL